MTDEPYAAILSFNRETKEMLHLEFPGEEHDDPGHTAEDFIRHTVKPDFPPEDGWVHLVWKNQAAADVMTQEMLGVRDKVKEAEELVEGTGYEVK